MERRIGDRQLLNVVLFFLIVQFGGLLLTFMALPLSQIPSAQASGTATQFTFADLGILIVEIIVITFIMIYVMKRFKGFLSASLLEIFIVVPGSLATFSIIIGFLFPNASLYTVLASALVLSIILLIIKRKRPQIRNIVVLISTMGIATYFGVIGFGFIYTLMGLIAIYDYVAVFITKHMMTLANLAAEKNLALFVSSSDVQMVPNQYLDKKELAEIKKSDIVKKIQDPTIKKFASQGNTPYVSKIGLGGGDLLLPLMLTISTYVSFYSYFIPVIVIIGSTAGVTATLLILKKYKVPLPAIPPIFAFDNLFLGILFMVYKPAKPGMYLPFLIIFAVIMLIMIYTLNLNRKKDLQQKS